MAIEHRLDVAQEVQRPHAPGGPRMTTASLTIPSTRRYIKSRTGYARRQAVNVVMLSLTGLFTALALVPL